MMTLLERTIARMQPEERDENAFELREYLFGFGTMNATGISQ